MLHRIEFIGNLTRDPEARLITNGNQVLTLNVAVNDWVKDPDAESGYREKATFYRVSIFGQRVQRLADQLHKGDKVFVEGRPELRTWTKANGDTATEIQVAFGNAFLVAAKVPRSAPTAPAKEEPATSDPAEDEDCVL